MSILIRENPFDLPGEVQAILSYIDGGDELIRLAIHPWERKYQEQTSREVSITLGSLGEDGAGLDDSDDWNIGIFDRDDFVEAILAVLPELKRA